MRYYPPPQLNVILFDQIYNLRSNNIKFNYEWMKITAKNTQSRVAFYILLKIVQSIGVNR